MLSQIPFYHFVLSTHPAPFGFLHSAPCATPPPRTLSSLMDSAQATGDTVPS